jgi:hypothetical protein
MLFWTCAPHQDRKYAHPSLSPQGPQCCRFMTSHMQTSQLLESLHSSRSLLESSMPPGLLIANDSDYKRTHVLIHQTARLPSPAFVVTNVDASIFPALFLPPDDDTAESSRRKNRHLLFDRILCDVPCSGDGTIRKNVGIWKKWSPMDGNGLHSYVLISTHCTGKLTHITPLGFSSVSSSVPCACCVGEVR